MHWSDILLIVLLLVWVWHFITDDTIPYMYGGDGKIRLRNLGKNVVRCWHCGYYFVYKQGTGLCHKCKEEAAR